MRILTSLDQYPFLLSLEEQREEFYLNGKWHNQDRCPFGDHAWIEHSDYRIEYFRDMPGGGQL